jgi:hypothetical protein
MQWNLEQLRLFVSVAEQPRFPPWRAAQGAVGGQHIHRPAGSDLGVTLFERSSGRQPR